MAYASEVKRHHNEKLKTNLLNGLLKSSTVFSGPSSFPKNRHFQGMYLMKGSGYFLQPHALCSSLFTCSFGNLIESTIFESF
jgi:hypothetical protein